MENPYAPPSPLGSTYTPNFSIGYTFGKAFEVFKANIGLVLGAFLVYALILYIPNLILGSESFLATVIVLIVGGPMVLGFQGLLLKLVRNETAAFSNLFDGFQKLGQAIGVYLLTAIAVGVGIILLIVPGIIVWLGLWPVFMLVYDGSQGVVDTLKRAWDLTNGHKMTLFVLFLVTIIFIMAGVIALIVGVFVTGAIGSIVFAVAYEELSLSKA